MNIHSPSVLKEWEYELVLFTVKIHGKADEIKKGPVGSGNYKGKNLLVRKKEISIEKPMRLCVIIAILQAS